MLWTRASVLVFEQHRRASLSFSLSLASFQQVSEKKNLYFLHPWSSPQDPKMLFLQTNFLLCICRHICAGVLGWYETLKSTNISLSVCDNTWENQTRLLTFHPKDINKQAIARQTEGIWDDTKIEHSAVSDSWCLFDPTAKPSCGHSWSSLLASVFLSWHPKMQKKVVILKGM